MTNKPIRIPLYFAIVFIFFLSLSPVRLLSYIILIALTASLLPLRVKPFGKLLLGVLTFYSVVTLVGSLSFLLGVSVQPWVLVIVHSLVLVLLAGSVDKELSLAFSGNRIKSVALGLAVFFSLLICLCRPLITQAPNQIFRIVSFGGDNISHLELVKSVESSKGYLYEPPQDTAAKMSEGLSGYPQGMHLNFYVLSESLRPYIDIYSTSKRLAISYYVFVASIYILLLLVAFQLSSLLQDKNADTRSELLSASMISILFSGIFFSLFALGFQTQVAALALFLGMLIFLTESLKTNEISQLRKLYLLAALSIAGISFTWIFLLPVSFIVFISMLLYKAREIGFTEFFKHSRWLIYTLVPIGFLSSIQVFVQILFKSTKLIGVNEIGFTQKPNILIVIVIGLVAIHLLAISHRKRMYLPMVVGIVVSAGFSLIIALYNITNVGEVRYYYYKSLFSILLLCTVLISSQLSLVLTRTQKELPKFYATVSYVCILVASLIAVSYNLTNKSDFFVLKNSGGISTELADTAVAQLAGIPDKNTARSIVAVGSCNRAQDYTVTRLVGALGGVNDEARQALFASMLSSDKSELLTAIENYQRKVETPLTIYSTDKDIQKYLAAELSKDPTTEYFIDLDFGVQPKSIYDCPNIVR